MNDQLQQIFSLQQALATAAAAAVINNLINPQQQQQQLNPNQNPNSNNSINIGNNNQPQQQIHDVNSQANQLQNLLLQLQQQAALQQQVQAQADLQQFQPQQPLPQLQLPQMTQNIAQINQPNQSPLTGFQGLNNISPSLTSTQSILSALSSVVNNSTSQQVPNQHLNLTHQQQNLNLNLNQHHSLSPNLSPNISHNNSRHNNLNSPTLNHQQASLNNINSSCNKSQTPIKKLKRNHNQQASDATSKPQTTPVIAQSQISKNINHSTQLPPRNSSSSAGSSSSTTFSNLPRKLVRGQDVWLGRGAEQTRQILKCMWCGQSFKSLAEMTEHMKLTQHYTNIISQEQLTSWRHPETGETKKSNSKSSQKNSGIDSSSDLYNDSDQDEFISGDEGSSVSLNKIQNSAITMKSDESVDGSHNGSDHADCRIESLNNIDSSLLNPEKLDSSNLKTSDDDNHSLNQHEDNNSTKSNTKEFHQKDNVTNKCVRKPSKSSANSKNNIKSDQNNDNHDQDDDEIHHVIKGMLEDGQDVESRDKVDPGSDDRIQSPSGEGVDSDSNTENEGAKPYDYNPDYKSDNLEALNDIERNIDLVRKAQVQAQVELLQRNLFAQTDEVHTKSSQICPTKGDSSGDPLSALESMVETNVSSSGVGILQRLGIDEEVGPPWQHINYANWCAAAYGNPMAAALLAAGLNFQNGLRLTKNLRKNED